MEEKIRDLLRRYDSVRKEISETLRELQEEQSEYYKEDYRILHEIEGAKDYSLTEKVEFFNKAQKLRSDRRNIKGIINLLDSIHKSKPYNTERLFDGVLENKQRTDRHFSRYYSKR